MTDEMKEKAENCRLAMKAALEAIQDYCGTGVPEGVNYIKFAGDVIEYPDSVRDILDSPAPPETQIEKIAATPWAKETAHELCDEMFEGSQPEVDACAERIRKTLADEVLFQRFKWVKKE